MQARQWRKRSARKREQVIRAGKTMFLRKGFAAASMDAIAANAGVSKMTVYRHFRSKELLFAGVIEELCRRIVDDDLESLLALAPPAALRRFADRVVAIIFARDTVELHRVVVSESRRFPELGRLFYRSGPQTCIEMLEAYLRRHRPRGWSNTDVRRHAEEFLDLIRGYPHLRLVLGIARRPAPRELRARIDSAVDILLSAMAAGRRGRRSRPPARPAAASETARAPRPRAAAVVPAGGHRPAAEPGTALRRSMR